MRLALAFALVVAFCGCGTEVAQTAYLEPAAPLDCATAGALALPHDSVFGDGKEARSLLAAGVYAAGEGPGLYVTARDAFRVYLNGALVSESREPRHSSFVPLSLLPGDNALSVVVAARRGTPAALVELQDLDQSVVSDRSWKVSTAPEQGFTAANFNDSTWPAVTDFGPRGALSGCDPESDFPAMSSARWIGPANGSGGVAVLRQSIRLAPVGFGHKTTGGGKATPTLVSNWDDLLALASDDTPATLLLPEGIQDWRGDPLDQSVCPSVCTSFPDKTLYQVLSSGQTCATALVTEPRRERRLPIGSNKTIFGLGRGAALRGVSLDLGKSENIILRNLAVFDVNPTLVEADDAFRLSSPRRVWLDHCSVKWVSDGFADISANSAEITLSWMHFDGVNAAACDGQHKRAVQITDASATLHHCFFDHVETHSPSVSGALAQVHLFDNLLSDNPAYGVNSACGSQVLLEQNTFQRIATPTTRSTCPDDTLPGLINAPDGSNFYGDDVGPHHGGDGMEPHDTVFAPPYPYETTPASDTWLDVLTRAGAGGRWAVPLSLD